MYRHGLGDCFLLAFGKGNNQHKFVLIDCGVLVGTKNGEQRMVEVVKDIKEATGNHLDALVVTHEHWDHISGFVQAQEQFDGLEVDQVWFAWTEDPKNPLARELRERRKAALNGLQVAMQQGGAAPPLFARRIESVNAFFGPGLGAAGGATTEDAMHWIKQKWKKRVYCTPGGTPLQIDGLPDVRFYVLGPPTDPAFIRKSRPSSKGGQVYLDDLYSGQLGYYLSALGAAPVERQSSLSEKRYAPFDDAYHCKPSNTDVLDVVNRYNRDPWRHIETDWTGAAGELALRLDAHTNNTSLVLAIELGPKDKVMLFTGDAQVGNWLSWEAVKWDGDEDNKITNDLLSRAVFYKVGHHGSHNATLREKGLESMTNGELVAFIPVNQGMAKKRRWRMPHKPLYERLVERTLGRVVLSDAGLPMATSDAVLEAFRSQCIETDLFVDYPITRWEAGTPRPRKKKSAVKAKPAPRKRR
jgi:beta-lactamase superfamily II metal-dependent hydrolase